MVVFSFFFDLKVFHVLLIIISCLFLFPGFTFKVAYRVPNLKRNVYFSKWWKFWLQFYQKWHYLYMYYFYLKNHIILSLIWNCYIKFHNVIGEQSFRTQSSLNTISMREKIIVFLYNFKETHGIKGRGFF